MSESVTRRIRAQQQLAVDRAREALDEVRKVFDRQGPEWKEQWRVRVAERTLEDALARLHKPIKLTEEQKAEVEEARLAQRAPPNLEDFVMMHGISDVATRKMISGYERITPEEWIQWDADMAEWKRKVREGAFDAKVW